MTNISKMLRMKLSRSNSHNNINNGGVIPTAVQEVIDENGHKTNTMMSKRNSVPRDKRSSLKVSTSIEGHCRDSRTVSRIT